jgi:hypothetical protein
MLIADRPTTSRWAPPFQQGGKHSLSSQADPRRQEPRPTLRQQDTLAGVNRFLSQTSVQPSTLREPSPARAPQIQHRDRFRHLAVFRVGDGLGDLPIAVDQASGLVDDASALERPNCRLHMQVVDPAHPLASPRFGENRASERGARTIALLCQPTPSGRALRRPSASLAAR